MSRFVIRSAAELTSSDALFGQFNHAQYKCSFLTLGYSVASAYDAAAFV